MSKREQIKRALEVAGLHYVSNSTVDDIISIAGSGGSDNSYELEKIKERLEAIESQLGIDND